ncbi:SDR family oxidoreductase [Candidatus Kryptobacter tengchongensis]|uniref:Thioester reductase domain-containing protein n=1 Tax=Kryptobacter tengchongensis TaxID=1643429 RepID=A0A916PBU7_KRYT1|nr:SDR family oxidoreductase [Candidatus Kryptobacter tengchongensis]CUT01247.1 Thioester reductase domain-containing protein [Candidatus Kryptobacter tengchongensis]
MSVALFTGFPGFIGTRLIKRLFSHRADIEKFYLLVQEKYLDLANETIGKILIEFPPLSESLEVVKGDITLPNLGLENPEKVKKEITECFHLAAVYDLAVSFETGYKVNVKGTENVVKFLRDCPNLKRFNYISTAYVSGLVTGVFTENDFDLGQGFKNFYEETKFLAEKLVRDNMSYIPTTIYRPGIVVGDSKTGETAKFDGPYYVILLMMRLPSYSPFPRVGSGEAEVNIVPVDYVVNSIAYLSRWDETIGRVFHLTDPRPHKVFELVEIFAQRLGKKFIYFQISPQEMKKLMKPKIVQKILGMPVQLIDYFDHHVHYDCSGATAILSRGYIECPDLLDYVDVMIDFVRRNRRKVAKHGLS